MASIRTPDLTRRGPLDVLRGFLLPLRALGLVFSTRRLALLTLAVAAITGVTVTVLVILLWHTAPGLVDWAWKPQAVWYAQAAHKALEVLVFLLLFVAGANTLPLMLAAPLMDPLSVATEGLLGVPATDGGLRRMVREVLRAWANALVRLIVLLLGQLLLLPILLIPAAGGPLWTALSWIWTAIWVCAAYLDVPMARHLYRFEDELAAVKQRPAVCLGFGAAVALMLYVPLLNFFFVPVAVVAGTLLFRGLLAAGAIAPPQRQS
jgi:CysZ protein